MFDDMKLPRSEQERMNFILSCSQLKNLFFFFFFQTTSIYCSWLVPVPPQNLNDPVTRKKARGWGGGGVVVQGWTIKKPCTLLCFITYNPVRVLSGFLGGAVHH